MTKWFAAEALSNQKPQVGRINMQQRRVKIKAEGAR